MSSMQCGEIFEDEVVSEFYDFLMKYGKRIVMIYVS